ncbi:hypothetical protein [Paenibacillus silviterrae]|uniref:hypothetical protein n=1 Tax=Paenibacillus silviterrae TaxID=3242194 RepID=UPI002543AAC3|nr:hypothetical protein [Paenibacillus chinjuensis]
MQNGDGVVIFLLIAALMAWLILYIKKKMQETVEAGGPIGLIQEEEVPEDETTILLEEHGYRTVCGKKRIPIDIQVNGVEVLQSRLFLDYIVEKDEQYYVVKLAKERKPMEMTGSSVREHLLIYQYIVPKMNGVIYVQLAARQIDVFEFRTELTDL